MADVDPAGGHQRRDVPQAQVEPEAQPHDLADDDRREPVPVEPLIRAWRRTHAEDPPLGTERTDGTGATKLTTPKRSFHVDAYVNDYLRDVEREVFERNDRKLDVSSSAVVRLAFRVLAEQMTAAQVVDRLAATPTTDGPGRKRR